MITAENNRLKAKHIGLPFYATRSFALGGIIEVKHIGTEDNIADGFTKSLEGNKHKDFYSRLFK
eukprot:6920031-Prorocentrum_lima.AAC.1